ncbi:MAG: HDOD domain-containing protein [bacterium]|nr:HDOD domain-containing protein [bacterium]
MKNNIDGIDESKISDSLKDVSQASDVLKRLAQALKNDGDFPVRAKTVADLQRLADDPNSSIKQISDVILREPSLGTRVLHLVNSAFYARPEPVVTITQAVIQLGIKAITQLCAGLILMQQFTRTAERGRVFGDNLKRSILTSLITRKLVHNPSGSGNAEKGFLAGAFYNLGYLLLSYYFPQIYEAAAKRARARGLGTLQSLSELLGVSREELTTAVLSGLEIPEYYQEVLRLSLKRISEIECDEETRNLIVSLKTASAISEIIVDHESRQQLHNVISSLADSAGISREHLYGIIRELPAYFQDHCKFIEMNSLVIPEYLKEIGTPEFPTQNNSFDVSNVAIHGVFSEALANLRQAAENNEPRSSLLAMVMETLAYDLDFDRVFLLVLNQELNQLEGRMAVGLNNEIDPASLSVQRDDDNPLFEALDMELPAIIGTPLLSDGWPFIVIPICSSPRNYGVIYADSIESRVEKRVIDDRLLAGFGLITNLLRIKS